MEKNKIADALGACPSAWGGCSLGQVILSGAPYCSDLDNFPTLISVSLLFWVVNHFILFPILVILLSFSCCVFRCSLQDDPLFLHFCALVGYGSHWSGAFFMYSVERTLVFRSLLPLGRRREPEGATYFGERAPPVLGPALLCLSFVIFFFWSLGLF